MISHILFQFFVLTTHVCATLSPTGIPSGQPSLQPSGQPSSQPSSQPTAQPSGQPTGQPTGQPSTRPTITKPPTGQPSGQPTTRPTRSHLPSGQPSSLPTTPTGLPSNQPSGQPSGQPSSQPTSMPTNTFKPTYEPSVTPTGRPTSSQPTLTYKPTTHTPTTYFHGDKVLRGSYVHLDRKEGDQCRPSQIEIGIAFNVVLYRRQAIAIETPGLTSGPCTVAKGGPDIYPLIAHNTSLFSAKFFDASSEGRQAYNSSYIRLVALENLVARRFYVFRIDRNNGIKHSCVLRTDWKVKLKRIDALGVYVSYRTENTTAKAPAWWSPLYNYETIGSVNFTSWSPSTCNEYASTLDFFPPHPLLPMAINFTLQLPFHLFPGDNITLYLPGLTSSGNFSRGMGGMSLYNLTSGRDESVSVTSRSRDLVLPSETNSSFSARWIEGEDAIRFSDSRLVLEVTVKQLATSIIYVTIPRTAGLSAVCGSPRNYSGFQFEVHSSQQPGFSLSRRQVVLSSPIGPGCAIHNHCSGHGTCDYCTSTCRCQSNYGSPAERALLGVSDLPSDCSGFICPFGVSFAAPPLSIARTNASGAWNDSSGLHRSTECSSSGLCDRSRAVCQCFEGFVGRACERTACPGAPVCSGRGLCYTLGDLSSVSTALPLRVDVSGQSEFYRRGLSAAAWDSDKGTACVCDSSWDVGLAAGQTQVAEYFGPSCQFRRCPSGDDPTTEDDETDCYNTTSSATVIGVGNKGNKCHVDCSNRGVCDYNSGVCKCFKGYLGPNCSILFK